MMPMIRDAAPARAAAQRLRRSCAGDLRIRIPAPAGVDRRDLGGLAEAVEQVLGLHGGGAVLVDQAGRPPALWCHDGLRCLGADDQEDVRLVLDYCGWAVEAAALLLVDA